MMVPTTKNGLPLIENDPPRLYHVFHLPIGEYKGIHGAVDYMVFFMFLGGGRPKLETAILVGVDRRNIKYFLL